MTRWSWSSTADEVVDAFKSKVEGKAVVITGAGSGAIGSAIALSIARGLPAALILPGHDRSDWKRYFIT
ncbi:uncharacterized protein F5Z01DRAFT_659191 [Emericellopsis atlantica]|uniref:Uncharacterized protein n=1 Tax=Emericellopsis atlantica TaxID=2614577 RepID=A0A9P7ZJJ9_9HYPO|nr:uncharacterized protein F5Z01DRAFT_659191 [Emericellopsis atlantica]KAG9253121.1 hypothetical protein F5Z01DRAFT_659191 [Emericellopsis atlantica]